MENMTLTKDAQYMLSVIYKEYLDKINNGISKREAKVFGNGRFVYDLLFPEMLFDDFIDTMNSLSKKELLKIEWASNKIYLSSLTDEGIIYMENKFGNDLKKIVSVIANLKSIIF